MDNAALALEYLLALLGIIGLVAVVMVGGTAVMVATVDGYGPFEIAQRLGDWVERRLPRA